MITQKRIKELVEYRNGFLYWKVNTHRGQQKIGDMAGSHTHSRGYSTISLDRKSYLIHRIVWVYHNGDNLKINKFIDHIDENKRNNRIENLRIANNGQNMQNRDKQKNNKSGYKGVCWNKCSKKWHAQISCKGVKHSIGFFKTKVDAAIAYNDAAKKLHKGFQKLNIII